MMSKNELSKKCIVCGNLVNPICDSGHIRRKRGKNAITCSHNCSRIYQEIYRRVFNQIIYRREVNKNGRIK